jgi:hypothetical protein
MAAEIESRPTINVDYLLGKLKSNVFNNEVNNYQIYDPRYSHHFPWFNFMTIETMLRDPRIKFGLNLIKGPIATYTKFFTEEEADSPDIHTAIVELDYHFPYAVVCKNKDQEQFIIQQFNRFWEVGIHKALKAIEWGFSGSQVLYRRNSKGQLIFDNLHPYNSQQLRCLTRNSGIIGFIRDNDRSRYIPLGKGFWHLHAREQDNYYGESRLKGAHVPWHETWMLGGARDIRRTWFFRHAYDGGEIYYPEGFYQDENGQNISNEHLAVKMAEAKRTGSTAIFPSRKDLQGKRQWEYEPPKAGMTPQGLPEYIQVLRDEELEGMGIPPEVVTAGGDSGFGGATGRMVPLMAFIASLTPIGCDLINDFRQQILDPVLLPLANFKEDYELKRIVPKTPPSGPVSSAATKTIPDSGLN